MDEDVFRDRLSNALKAEVPPDANRGSWIGRRADELNINEDRFGAYLHGENKCPGWNLVKLFDKYGPVFEAKVRGTKPTAPPDINKAREYAEKLLRELGVQDDEGVIADDFSQRVRRA